MGVAGYVKEEYPRWREEAPDSGLASYLSYDEWRKGRERLVSSLHAEGFTVTDITVKIDAFLRWRDEHPGRDMEDHVSWKARRLGLAGTVFDVHAEKMSPVATATTKELVDRLARCARYVPKDLVEEVVRRPDAGRLLADLLHTEECWSSDRPSEGWTSIHALQLLSACRDLEGFKILLDVLRTRPDDLSDSLTEDIPSMLTAYGPVILPELEAFVLDKTVDVWPRLVVADAIGGLGYIHEEVRQEAKRFLADEMKKTNDIELSSSIVCTLANFRDADLKGDLWSTFERGMVEPMLIGWQNVEDIYEGNLAADWHRLTKNPLEHFKFHRTGRLGRAREAAPGEEAPAAGAGQRTRKVGRNEPCPCGSGKKSKKCHGGPNAPPIPSP